MKSGNKIIATSLTFCSLVLSNTSYAKAGSNASPNFIIIFTDDMGYGDLGVYGHPTIKTPNLDKMAAEGQKWTSFYAAAPVSTPSRAGLLTGRLPVRSGMCSEKRRVLFPDSKGGLPQSEITIAKLLKQNGYQTAAIGKWHLGHSSPFLPTDHGFDSYYGIPYSNDMDKTDTTSHFILAENERYSCYNVPLIRNGKIIERPVDQRTITSRYTDETIKQIKANKKKPFFIYLAYNMPHVPLFRSQAFKGISKAGIYGDVIEELDASVGRILETLKKEGIADKTIVVFSSDNGPWLSYKTHGGSAGLLSGGKGGTMEGGMRVPGIFWCPGKIKQGTIMDIGSTLDILSTFLSLAKIKIPTDRVYDGYDLSGVLKCKTTSPRKVMFYYRDTSIYAIRLGSYKAHFYTRSEYGSTKMLKHLTPLLYNLDTDPAEKFDISVQHPEVIAEMQKILDEHNSGIVKVENQLEK